MSLARWAHVVRQSYRQIQEGGKPALALTKEMIARLEAIGFRLRVKERGKFKQVPFEERLKSLAEFKNVHGHVNVGEAVDSKLAQFCNQMRTARRKPLPGVTMKLSQDRISALDALGFVWEPRKLGGCKRARRSERILELKRYVDEHGELPTRRSNTSLCVFGNTLRKKHIEGKLSLSRQDLATLNEIGFEWETHKKKRSRSRSDNMAVQYDEEGASALNRPVLVPGRFQPASVSYIT